MKRIFQFAAMAGLLVGLSSTSAKADGTLTYTLMPQGSSTPLATWDMPLNPTPTCSFSPCSDPGNYFAYTTGVSFGGAPSVPDTLFFLNTMFMSMNVDLSDESFLIPEFTGPQLYSSTSNESDPMMIIPPSGFFTLVDDGADGSVAGTTYNLYVAQTPEPGTLLLLGSGLVAIAMRRRRAAR
jgi:PEP-CTERM motif